MLLIFFQIDMGCFEHRYYHNKKTYVLFFLTMNYKDATQVCKATGGQIVIIRDAETSDFISKLRTDTR